MATLSGGILGTVSGKVAGVVAGQWKDKNYIRKHSIPANPNTIQQQTQRGLFGGAVSFGKLILGQILNPFVDPFQRSMSGFNYFIKQNISEFTTPPSFSNIKVTFGKLFLGTIGEPEYISNNVKIHFETTTGTNGSGFDKISACVMLLSEDGEISKVFFSSSPVSRLIGTINIPIGTLSKPTPCRVYVYAAQYDNKGALIMVSDSQNSSATLAP